MKNILNDFTTKHGHKKLFILIFLKTLNQPTDSPIYKTKPPQILKPHKWLTDDDAVIIATTLTINERNEQYIKYRTN